MKRIASTVLVVLAVALTSTTIFGQASVPNLVNFQGRLLNNLGSPVADGSYGVTFRLFDAAVGGSLIWAETSLVNTSGGVFTHQLGADNPLGVTLFQDYDSLFLEIVVGGETITPRTRLTSAPYTRLAGGIEVPSNSTSPETLAIATLPNIHNLVVFGNDGKRNVEIGGTGFGEIWLRDGTAGNNLIADLTATTNSGGSLILKKSGGSAGVDINAGIAGGGSTLNMRNDVGSVTVSFDADQSGNIAAVLPTGSVSAAEMYDEPGLAHEFKYDYLTLSGGTAAIDTTSIAAPAAGYVVVTAHAFFYFTSHTKGNTDYGRVSLSSTAGLLDFNNFAIESVDSSLGSYSGDMGYRSVSLTKVEAVSAGTYTYYLNANKIGTGNVQISRIHLTAMYFPTAYGTVVNTLAQTTEPNVANLSVAGPVQISEGQVQRITMEEHNARLQEELKTMHRELEARIQKLEAQINLNRQSAGAEE